MVRFPPSIPGEVKTKNIIAKSNINKKIYIKSVNSSNPNKVTAKLINTTIERDKFLDIIEVSTVPFDHVNSLIHFSKEMLDYITLESSFPHNLNENLKDEEPVLTYFDILAWQVEQKQWDNRDLPKTTDTSSIITIDTNMVQNITIPVNTVITKPSLLNQDVYEFDKIEVGTEKRGSITIHNPSPNPLEVSFNIAPANFMDNIINTILSIENRPKWEII